MFKNINPLQCQTTCKQNDDDDEEGVEWAERRKRRRKLRALKLMIVNLGAAILCLCWLHNLFEEERERDGKNQTLEIQFMANQSKERKKEEKKNKHWIVNNGNSGNAYVK